MSAFKLGIIILNWNGWNDTLECLASLMANTFQDFQVILIDNGSTDDSVQMIISWAGEENVSLTQHQLKNIEHPLDGIKSNNHSRIVLMQSPENLGFARGCNVGLRYAMQIGFDYICLLNNDTTVARDAMGLLYDFMERNSDYEVITPIIYYYHRPDTVWNFGGRLTFTGRRKYYLGNRRIANDQVVPIKKITFLTGCALFARTSIFSQYGLLTEAFFFGEEDYEFCLRMRANRVKMAAVSCAKVFHKVNASNDLVDPPSRLAHAFAGYLNRFIDRKLHSRTTAWHAWRLVCLMVILPMLMIRHRLSIGPMFRFGKLLWTYSSRLNGVSREDFLQIKGLFKA